MLRSLMDDVDIQGTPVVKKETCRQLTAFDPLTFESFDAVTPVSADFEMVFSLLVSLPILVSLPGMCIFSW